MSRKESGDAVEREFERFNKIFDGVVATAIVLSLTLPHACSNTFNDSSAQSGEKAPKVSQMVEQPAPQRSLNSQSLPPPPPPPKQYIL